MGSAITLHAGKASSRRCAVLVLVALLFTACGTQRSNATGSLESTATNTRPADERAETNVVESAAEATTTTIAPATAIAAESIARSESDLAAALSNEIPSLDERVQRIAEAFANTANRATPTATTTTTTIELAPVDAEPVDDDGQVAPDTTNLPTTTATPTTVTPTTVTPTTVAPTTVAAPDTQQQVDPTTTAPTTAATPTTRGILPANTGRFPTSPLSQIGPNLEGALLGISTGLSTAEREPRFNFLEQLAGREFDIGHVFHAWNKPIPTKDDLIHLDEGRILMISWNGTDTIEIQNGVHDDWIRTQATSVRNLEQPVMLRWLWEMDGNRRRDWVHSGEDFVGAWNHIRDIFTEVGATNAQFVWCPNAFLFWDGGDPTPWYPGDENVDWLCADGYNWGDSVNGPDWMSFTEIFEDFVAWAEPRNLPIVIGETGSNEATDDPNGRADWLRDVPVSLRNDLPAIDALVYFDKDFRFADHPDWRVDTTPQAFAAWNEIARNEYLNPLE